MCRAQVPIAVPKIFLNTNCSVCIEVKRHCTIFACGHWTCTDCASALVILSPRAASQSAPPQALAATQALAETQSFDLQSSFLWGYKIGQNLGNLAINNGLLVCTLPSAVAASLMSAIITLIHDIKQEIFIWENQQVMWSWNQHYKGWILMTKENVSSSPWQGWSKPPIAVDARELSWDSRNCIWICW